MPCTELDVFRNPQLYLEIGSTIFIILRVITLLFPAETLLYLFFIVFSLKDVKKVLLLGSEATLHQTDDLIPAGHPDPLRGERDLQTPVLLHPLVSPVAPHGLPQGADDGHCQGEGGLADTFAGVDCLLLGPGIPQQSYVELGGNVRGSRNLQYFLIHIVYPHGPHTATL